MLDTGLGTPKHPLFLLGKKYGDAGSKPSRPEPSRVCIGSLTRLFAKKTAARESVAAAPAASRDAAMHDQQTQPVESRQTMSGLPLHQAAALAGLSHSRHASDVGPSRNPVAAVASLSTMASRSMQQAKSAHCKTWISRLSCGASGPYLHAANPGADPAAPHMPSAAGSATDLEAQNDVIGSSALQNNPVSIAAAHRDAIIGSDSRNSEECCDGHNEPPDVAAERAKADRLWAERDHEGGHCRVSLGGSSDGQEIGSNPTGPAILLHNLRKVCILHMHLCIPPSLSYMHQYLLRCRVNRLSHCLYLCTAMQTGKSLKAAAMKSQSKEVAA